MQNSVRNMEKQPVFCIFFLQNFRQKSEKKITRFCSNFEIGAVQRIANLIKSCSSRKMLKNAYLSAKIGFDAEENEPSKFGDLAE